MTRENDGPRSLGESLRVGVGRFKRVDLLVMDDIRALWPRIVDPILADKCHPDLVRDGTLVVSVPSGAFAQRIGLDEEQILVGLSVLGERAPKHVRCVIRP